MDPKPLHMLGIKRHIICLCNFRPLKVERYTWTCLSKPLSAPILFDENATIAWRQPYRRKCSGLKGYLTIIAFLKNARIGYRFADLNCLQDDAYDDSMDLDDRTPSQTSAQVSSDAAGPFDSLAINRPSMNQMCCIAKELRLT